MPTATVTIRYLLATSREAPVVIGVRGAVNKETAGTTDLRAFTGWVFNAPSVAGNYPLTMYARTAGGCEVSRAFTVTVR